MALSDVDYPNIQRNHQEMSSFLNQIMLDGIFRRQSSNNQKTDKLSFAYKIIRPEPKIHEVNSGNVQRKRHDYELENLPNKPEDTCCMMAESSLQLLSHDGDEGSKYLI